MQGLQVWDNAGNLVVDNTSRLTLYLGTVTLTKGGQEDAVITDSRFSQGTPFYVCTTVTSRGSARVDFVDNRMSIRLVDGLRNGNYSVTIIYGIY